MNENDKVKLLTHDKSIEKMVEENINENTEAVDAAYELLRKIRLQGIRCGYRKGATEGVEFSFTIIRDRLMKSHYLTDEELNDLLEYCLFCAKEVSDMDTEGEMK